jgi:hypothetical protein
MNRYHIEVYTNSDHKKALEGFTDRLNGLNWRYTRHSIDNIKYRVIDLESVLIFIRDLKLESGQIFEYYLRDNLEPEKVCYRVEFNSGIDLILVINQYKEIITIYINSREDRHIELKKELYQRA